MDIITQHSPHWLYDSDSGELLFQFGIFQNNIHGIRYLVKKYKPKKFIIDHTWEHRIPYKFLDTIFDEFNVDIDFYYGNYTLPEHPNPRIKIYMADALSLDLVNHSMDMYQHYKDNQNKPFKNHYTCFAGTGRTYRTKFINYIYENHLDLYGTCTLFPGKDKQISGLDTVCQKLKDVLPLTFETNYNQSNFPHDMLNYPNRIAYIDIALESSFPKQLGYYYTEKVLRNFKYMTPFLLAHDKGTLQHLKDLGFKTFDGILFDESYDNLSGMERLHAMQEELEKICKMSLTDLHDITYSRDMRHVLTHNHNQFYRFIKEYNLKYRIPLVNRFFTEYNSDDYDIGNNYFFAS